MLALIAMILNSKFACMKVLCFKQIANFQINLFIIIGIRKDIDIQVAGIKE